MGYDIYVIRPDKATTTVNLAKESALISPASASTVECMKIEAMSDVAGMEDIDNGRKTYALRNVRANPLRKNYDSYVAKDIYLGNTFGEISDMALYRLQNMKYALVEWPKVAGKVSQMAVYNTLTSAWVGASDVWRDPFAVYKSAAWTILKVLMDSSFTWHFDTQWNAYLDSLNLKETWS